MEHEGESLLGVIYLPALGEWVYAARGLGCWWLPPGHDKDSSPIRARVSSTSKLTDGLTIVAAYEYFAIGGQVSVADRLFKAGRTRGWGDCYGHVLVATGRADAAVEPLMHIWDNAAILPAVVEAGGEFTDWKGERRIDGGNAISTNGRVHGEVLRLVQR